MIARPHKRLEKPDAHTASTGSNQYALISVVLAVGPSILGGLYVLSVHLAPALVQKGVLSTQVGATLSSISSVVEIALVTISVIASTAAVAYGLEALYRLDDYPAFQARVVPAVIGFTVGFMNIIVVAGTLFFFLFLHNPVCHIQC